MRTQSKYINEWMEIIMTLVWVSFVFCCCCKSATWTKNIFKSEAWRKIRKSELKYHTVNIILIHSNMLAKTNMLSIYLCFCEWLWLLMLVLLLPPLLSLNFIPVYTNRVRSFAKSLFLMILLWVELRWQSRKYKAIEIAILEKTQQLNKWHDKKIIVLGHIKCKITSWMCLHKKRKKIK